MWQILLLLAVFLFLLIPKESAEDRWDREDFIDDMLIHGDEDDDEELLEELLFLLDEDEDDEC